MTTGLLLGKFMPPHSGHVYLAQFACQFVDHLYIVVGSLKSEPIAGKQRHAWMTDMFPQATVLHLDEELPQTPDAHPDFWQIWQDALLGILPEKPDYLFAGEDYGAPLAQTLGAEFIPSNMGRDIIPTSGTSIRTHPFENWQYIPKTVRPYFVKRICFVGAESTGKSSVAKKLATHFETVCVPEYAYTYIAQKGKDLQIKDMEHIARAQLSSEDALAREANKVLFCDTDAMTTALWSAQFFNSVPDWVTAQAETRHYDLYFLMDTDVAWKEDIHRYDPKTRAAFADRCEKKLQESGKSYIKLSGSWDEKFDLAVKNITALLQE